IAGIVMVPLGGIQVSKRAAGAIGRKDLPYRNRLPAVGAYLIAGIAVLRAGRSFRVPQLDLMAQGAVYDFDFYRTHQLAVGTKLVAVAEAAANRSRAGGDGPDGAGAVLLFHNLKNFRVGGLP